jgi:hypothetical protein
MSADQWNVIPEFLDKKIYQPTPMLVLFGSHVGKDFRAVRIALSQAFCEIEIDAAVLFFAADRKGQELTLVEFRNRFHHSGPS